VTKSMVDNLVSNDCIGVLYVDDEPMLTQMFSESLSRRGFKVYTASSGLEALSQINLHIEEISAVVTDVTMPDMDGIALAERLNVTAPGLPVLLITGMMLSGPPASCPANIVGTIVKPIKTREIAELIRSVTAKNNV
jgi:two-component system, cell cycle sensor histidine kinase and response regulator CckA